MPKDMRNISHKNKPRVFGTGLFALDVVLSADPAEPIYCWAGGTCGNVLIILSYLGWRASPIARLNGDPSSIRVKDDMSRWDVSLAFAKQSPTATTPIIAQQNYRDKGGDATHKFAFTCPMCGASLPFYKAVPNIAAKRIAEQIENPHVFFFDRVSVSALTLAKRCKELGAVIFFEPSAKGDPKQFSEAVQLAHVIKYSQERFSFFVDEYKSAGELPFIEIQTMGREGLIFRSSLPNAKSEEWTKLPATAVEQVEDTCGCGDWTTAGLISKLCDVEGVEGLKTKSLKDIMRALNFGQALASWNCRFVGARGGMYRVDRRRFEREISEITNESVQMTRTHTKKLYDETPMRMICPSCCGT